MANESEIPATGLAGWKPTQVYAMALICLVIGVALGYLFRGSESRPAQPAQSMAQPASGSALGAAMPQQMPTLDQMKHMADKQVEPLLEKLKADPNNSSLLNQIGTVYKATHQFQDAAGYYQKAVQADPKNVAARTDWASCLYYQGDVEGALKQLQISLQYDPKDANTLFNLGLIRWEAKKDSSGAVSAWQQLLKANPKLTGDRKAAVEKLIAQARQRISVNN